jgi:hypothetical protein
VWRAHAGVAPAAAKQGPDADRRAKLLIYLAVERSLLDAYSQSRSMSSLLRLLLSVCCLTPLLGLPIASTILESHGGTDRISAREENLLSNTTRQYVCVLAQNTSRGVRTCSPDKIVQFALSQRLCSNDDFQAISSVQFLHQDRHVVFDGLLADL